jgi:alpha-galactosidase
LTTKTYEFGDTVLVYTTQNGVTTFLPVPLGAEQRFDAAKRDLTFVSKTFGHVVPEPMVQVSLLGSRGARDWSAGFTMRNGESAYSFKLTDQRFMETETAREVVSELQNPDGLTAFHRVRQIKGHSALEISVELLNGADKPVTIEMLASFSISGISPFIQRNDTENIILHRMRSAWSAEGRLSSITAAELQAEDSWTNFGTRGERIGQIGSMPARGFLPFYAVEDKTGGVTWAVQIEAPASWQIEAQHHNSYLSLSGGLADYNYGHWRKTLQKGERFVTPKAFLTTTNDGLLKACDRLTDYMNTRIAPPPSEADLPIIYNEYCYTGGTPDIERLRPQITESARLGTEYFVMDAGWYRPDNGSWNDIGEWNVNKSLFPRGLSEFTAAVKAAGMLPGIWFEFEGLTERSEAFTKGHDRLLTRDGHVIINGDRCFADFRKPETIAFLDRAVIGLLKDNGFKYIKVDYNENIGVGVDGGESIGEGLRAHIAAVTEFFKKMRREIPDLVIEVCSSGGMRHEPLFLSLGSMASFSDAHAVPEGAVIAADLHRFMLPKQMQVWSTINGDYGVAETQFTLVKAMLGRLCLSGDLTALKPEIKETVRAATGFYRRIRGIIGDGETTLIDNAEIKTFRRLKGRQRLMRISRDGKRLLCFAFAFDTDAPLAFEIPDGFRVADAFGCGSEALKDGTLTVEYGNDHAASFGRVVLLEK